MIPLLLKIKREQHKNIARAQDIIIETIYKFFDKAVLHGGTAIWRCYKSNRFSEDIDMYINRDLDKIELFFKELEKIGFLIEKKKIGENSIYSSLRFNNCNVRFEALFKKSESQLADYETIDGNYITIYSLNPENLIKEKVDTYLKRRKIRDLYDIFFLLRYVKNKNEININLKKLLNKFETPADENDLKILIFEGLVPKTDKMVEYIKYHSN